MHYFLRISEIFLEVTGHLEQEELTGPEFSKCVEATKTHTENDVIL